MAVTVSSVGTFVNSLVTANTTVTIPTNQPGDILLLVTYGSVSTPSGWTAALVTKWGRVFSRVIDTTLSGTMTISGSGEHAWHWARLRGADTSAPKAWIVTASTANLSSFPNTFTVPDAPDPAGLRLHFVSLENNTPIPNWTGTPPQWTAVSSTFQNAGMHYGGAVLSEPPGAAGSRTLSGVTVGTSGNVVMTVVKVGVPPNTASSVNLVSPIDQATTHNVTPTLNAEVTDHDGGSLSLLWEVATDVSISSVVWSTTSTASVTTLAPTAAVSEVVSLTLSQDVEYFWRVTVTDDGGEVTRSSVGTFWVNRAPVMREVFGPTGLGAPGTKVFTWSSEDADSGDTQSAFAFRYRNVGDTVWTYWDGSDPVVGVETFITSTALTLSLPFSAAPSAWEWEVAVRDSFGRQSAYKAGTAFTVHSLPTVTIGADPATVVSTGGPLLWIGWDYAQTDGVLQAKYRVTVTNAAGDTTYYDSGLLSSHTANSLSIQALARGIPTDTTGGALKATVYVESTDGPDSHASDTKTFDIRWGVVTVDVIAPAESSQIATSQLTVEWTASSTRSKTIEGYRVRLLAEGSGATLFDTGWTDGTDTSLTLPYRLADGSRYLVGVQARNSEGVS